MRAPQGKTRRGGGSKLGIDRVSAKFKKGFTLAEVLITLAIIGVVAAITMPVLIQKHRNHVVETRLKKFYTVMNQAILKSEAEYGPKETWDFDDPEFFEKHFEPHIKIMQKGETFVDNFSSGFNYRPYYLPDGSMFVAKYKYLAGDRMYSGAGSNIDYFFFPNAKNFDKATFRDTRGDIGISYFVFQFYPANTSYYQHNRGMMPIANNLPEDLSTLWSGNAAYSCNTSASSYHYYCGYIIMQNGWKIPDNYPFKVK